MERVEEKHPAYGVLGFSKVTSSNGTPLFGSTLRHNQLIKMTVRRASVERNLNRDWVHGDEILLEAELSYNQFVEALISMNVGDGTPITLTYVEGERVGPCPYKDKRQELSDEFTEHMDEINKKPLEILKEIKNTLNNPRVTKKQLNAVLGCVNNLITELSCNVPFMKNAAQELIDQAVLEARSEVEAATSMAINKAGIKEINGDIEKLVHYITGGNE